MFTGIIESLGIVEDIQEKLGNRIFTVKSNISDEVEIDQSISHNGVCLTVIDSKNNTHKVEAIEETLQRSNLSSIKIGDFINLERSMQLSDRLDGHLVQGHVDTVARCTEIKTLQGSWVYTFDFNKKYDDLIVQKGSISVNGVSLTVVDPLSGCFQVAIIPYTFENTSFKTLKLGDFVNLEFDILGKYVKKALTSSFQAMLQNPTRI